MINTTGAEFKQFLNDSMYWPDDNGVTYYEDDIVTINAKRVEEYTADDLQDTDVITIKGGIVRGKGDDCTFEAYFKAWRKAQEQQTFTVTCKEVDFEKLKFMLIGCGCEVR